MHPGKSLLLLYALKSSPRLALLYLYLFDYTDVFLPFIHTICPLQEEDLEDILARLLVGQGGASQGAGWADTPPPPCFLPLEFWALSCDLGLGAAWAP